MPFDFAKHTTVESLDSVPTDFQPFYKETEDGGFVIDTENPLVEKSVSVISGLNKALMKARKEAKDAQGKQVDLSPLSDFGDSPQAIREAIEAKIAEERASKGKAAGEDLERKLEKARQDWEKASGAEKEAMAKRNEGLLSQLNRHLVSDRLTQAMITEGVDDPELLMPHVMPSVQAREVDGQFVVKVVDEEGDVRYGATGQELTLRERIQEMKGQERYGRFFKSEAPQGGGTSPGSTSRPPIPKGKPMNATDKIKVGLDKNQAIKGRRAS